MTARIERIAAYRAKLPFADGAYAISGGRMEHGFDSLVVAVETGAGLVGWGEMAPLGETYDPAFAGGARAALEHLAPALLGLEADQPAAGALALERALRGHPYARSALDIALWDLAGRAAGLSLTSFLGGRFQPEVDLYRVVPICDPRRAADVARALLADGYRRLQVKVGDDPDTDLERLRAVREAVGNGVALHADANGGWSTADARRFLRGLPDEPLVVEQPCATIEECASLRASCPWPIALDESIDGLASLLRARAAHVADLVTIKIARVGGLTAARLLRDVAVALRVPVTIEDTGGGQIVTAAIAHLAGSTPEGLLVQAYPMAELVAGSTAAGLPAVRDGRLPLPSGAGLGVEARLEALGDPIFEVAL